MGFAEKYEVSVKKNSMRSQSPEFVGRHEEKAFFAELLAAPPGQRPSLVVVRSRDGFGKSRLLAEFAAMAGARGSLAITASSGRSVHGQAYAIWEAAVLELASAAQGLPPPAESAGKAYAWETPQSAERADFFAEAANHLRDHARVQPLVVFLDDLDSTDAESILLLRYLAVELQHAPCIFVASIGTNDETLSAEMAVQIQKLLLDAHCLELSGLSYAAVDELLTRDQAVSFFHDISGGNPLLIRELLSLGATAQEGISVEEQGDLSALTQIRIEGLPAEVGELLVALAVYERPPTLGELAGLAGVTDARMADSMEQALDGGLVARIVQGPFQGHYEIAHAVMRVAALGSAAPALLQRMRARRVADLADMPVLRARHLLLMDGPVATRLAAVLDATRESLERFAFEDAVELGELGLALLPLHGKPEDATAALLSVALGEAQWRCGNQGQANGSYRRAAGLLAGLDCPNIAAEIALGPQLDFDLGEDVGSWRVQNCRDVLDRRTEISPMQEVKLLATVALAELERDPGVASAAAAEAMELAATLADPVAQAYALAAQSMTDLSPGTVAARLDAARRILAVVEEHNEFRLASVGYFLLLIALLEKGNIQELDVELSHRSFLVARFPELHHSKQAHWFRCLRAILDGDTVLAESLVLDAHAAATAAGSAGADDILMGQMGIIRWLQGKVDDAESSFLRARREHPDQLLWSVSLVWLWHKQGRTDAAERLFETLQDLGSIPRNRLWLGTVTALAEVASVMGPDDFANKVRNLLLPYAKQVIPLGIGVAFWGTVARSLGLLTERLGHLVEARELLRTAIDVSARSGAQAWLAEAQIELAEFTLRHPDLPGSCLIEVRAFLDQALASAQRRGFPLLAARALATQASFPRDQNAPHVALHPAGAAPTRTTAAAQTRGRRARVRVMGAFDVLSHEGERARWTSRKARELLKLLVSMRGVPTSREVFMDVLWPGLDPERLANRFAVAINTIRRAMDPTRTFAPQHFIEVDAESVRLRIDNVAIDVEEFFVLVRSRDTGDLRTAVELYAGDVFAEEPYAEWARAMRHEAQLSYCQVAVALAGHETAEGNLLSASQLFRSVLEMEPANTEAGQGLVATLTAMGAHGQAKEVTRSVGRWEREANAV